MPLPYLVAGVGIGVYIKGGTLTESAFWGLTTYAITQAVVHPIQTTTVVAKTVRYGFTTSLQGMGADALASKAVTTTAAVGAGYTIGAVTGTAIISVAESKGYFYEGATADVLDFYMGKGHYWDQGDKPTPGFFNIPGNISYIWGKYRD